MPRLIIIDRDGERTEVDVAEPFFTIGRSSACTVQIKDRGLSKRHARLYHTPDGYCIIDAGSKNGLSLNGDKVDRAVLREGDEIRMGGVVIHWELERARAGSDAPVDPAGLWDKSDGSTPAPAAAPVSAETDGLGMPAFKGTGAPAPAPAEAPSTPTDPGLKPVEGSDGLTEAPAEPTEPPRELELEPTSPPAEPGEAPPARPRPPSGDGLGRPQPKGAMERTGTTKRRPVPQAVAGIDDSVSATATAAVAGPADEVEALMARLKAEREEAFGADEAAAVAIGRMRRWIALAYERTGAPLLLAIGGGVLVLALMITHSRHVIDTRWQDGPPVVGGQGEGSGPSDEAAGALYREAQSVKETDPERHQALLMRLVREFPDTGWGQLARARLGQVALGSGSGAGSEVALSAADQLERALAAGRVAEALEGFRRLAVDARAANDGMEAARLEGRILEIEEQLRTRYHEEREKLRGLARSGEVAQLLEQAEEILRAYPLPEVRKELDALIAEATRPTPKAFCKKMIGALQVENHGRARALLTSAAASADLPGIQARADRLRELLRLSELLTIAFAKQLKRAPIKAPPALGIVLDLPAGATISGWSKSGLRITTGETTRIAGWDRVPFAVRAALIEAHLPEIERRWSAMAAYALLRGLTAPYAGARAQAGKQEADFARQTATWLDPLASWYRRQLR